MGPRLDTVPVLVVGAGIMGAGIAQVAALAGHPVRLYDLRPGAAADARGKLAATLDGLAAKGKLSADAARDAVARIDAIDDLAQAADVGLVIEAIVEQVEVKRALLKQLEAIVAPDCVLATNTSSISITLLANGLAQPGRLVGMHFFNPVPLMKLVEVVSGLSTDGGVAQAIFDLSRAWGKVPVHARSTPGFIVNRIARPYYAETLALLLEQAGSPQVLDACLRAAGFRMGPCELMDLIGHDTNFAVTQSVFEANFYDKRYVPSLVQREMVDGGLFGRKSGRGFYRYPEGVPAFPTLDHPEPPLPATMVVHGHGAIADRLHAAAAQAMARHGVAPARDSDSGWIGVRIDNARLVLCDGRPAREWAAETGLADVAVFDLPVAMQANAHPLAYAVNEGAAAPWADTAAAWLSALGFQPIRFEDMPGLVVARTLAMLINEAADAVQQGVCTPEAANAAMKLGVNYPAGPFEWLEVLGVQRVVSIVTALDACYRGERYRVSPWLRRRAVQTWRP
jgi:3-hydroxybutyryl-CoA dehydrogenase